MPAIRLTAASTGGQERALRGLTSVPAMLAEPLQPSAHDQASASDRCSTVGCADLCHDRRSFAVVQVIALQGPPSEINQTSSCVPPLLRGLRQGEDPLRSDVVDCVVFVGLRFRLGGVAIGSHIGE